MPFTELNTAGAIQRRLWKGYGKCAKKQGTLTGVYRPLNATNPFTNQLDLLPVIFTNSYGFIKPDRFGVASLLAVFDATGVQEGDYLVTPPFSDTYTESDESFSKIGGSQGHDVFYVASMDMNVPITVVRCPRTITISRINGPTGAGGVTKGALGYSGPKPGGETILMSGWRASVLQGTKGETNPAKLPTDIRMPWWTILCPYFPGVVVNTGDFVRDDLGRKYMISSAELTGMGWRITAAEERV